MKTINGISVPESEDVKNALGTRAWDSHKGTYGYVGILGGSLRYSGAAKLANLGAAAMRSGCGVVTLGVPDSIAHAVAPYLLESTLFPMPDAEGQMRFDRAALDAFLSGKRAISVGMGWGRSSEYPKILGYLLQNFSGAILLDADALNTLAEVATTEYSRQSNPQTMEENKRVSREGGDVAREARETMEKRLGRSVVSKERASDYILDATKKEKKNELPFTEE